MTAEQDGLDLAKVQAEHQPRGIDYDDGTCGAECYSDEHTQPPEWPCLPYRLAALALDLQGKVARVEAMLPTDADRHSKFVRVGGVLAALTDQTPNPTK